MPVDPTAIAQLEAVIAAAAEVLASVPNVGLVHSYRRSAASEEKFKALFVKDGKILGWQISRESSAAIDATIHSTDEQHSLVFRGYQGVEDSKGTEEGFQQLIETIRYTFLADRTLGAAVQWTEPMQVRAVTMGAFGNFLCHYCELSLVVRPNPVLY
jgi:hypothetical protein